MSSTVDIRNENGEIDYKKLYEEQLVENDRLKDKLRKSDEELKETKQTLEKINLVVSKHYLREEKLLIQNIQKNSKQTLGIEW